ncbi:MAG: YcxB family protein [Sandaracinaceae bacterium]|nr:YcxB family protein [Sandaracinaceae bacterium]
MSAYRNEGHVKLSYTIEREDLLEAVRAQRQGSVLRSIGPPSVALVVVLSLPMFHRLPLVAAALASGFVATMMALLVIAAIRAGRQRLDRDWEERRAHRLEVTEEAFEIHDATSGKRIAWELVTHWRETPREFLLYVEPHLFHVIPKRLLPSAEVQTNLRRLFEDRVLPGGEARLAAAARGSWVPFMTFVAILLTLCAAGAEAAAALLFQ